LLIGNRNSIQGGLEGIVEENISLEHLKLDHTQGLYDLTEANREYLRERLPWLDQIKSSSDTRKFIESTITSILPVVRKILRFYTKA